LDAAPELPPLYYLANFEVLCETVELQYGDLFGEAEQLFYSAWQELSPQARGLYVRLVSRVGPLFRSELLSYPELGELDAPLDELRGAGLAMVETSPAIDVVTGLCRKSELESLFAEELVGLGLSRKSEIVDFLLQDAVVADCCVERWRRWYDHRLVGPLQAETVTLLQLLFFGNRRQSLTDFVLSDLGVARYYPYALDRAYRLFESRDEVDEYLALGSLADVFYEAVESGDREAALDLLPSLLENSSGSRLQERRDRLRNRLARQCERWQAWEEALLLYAASQRAPARERRARVLQRMERFPEALQACLQIQQSPWCEEEQDFADRQVPLLRRKLGERPAAREKQSVAEERLVLPGTSQSVEMAVAGHYGQRWAHVYYVESGLVNGLFGLALWEQIFQPLPGAFVNPFQSAPLDMYSTDFYPRRRREIDARLASLDTAEILRCHDLYHGYSNHWVNWRLLDRELVERALACIPLAHLVSLWQRILFDPQANRSGLPDLVALDEERGYCMIEVKGPGDQLQANQRRWLRFFANREIPHKVAWVNWADD
jgi:hypothetical protein